ncbi:MAG: alpha/beta hydrolase [Desulfobacterales bacterium]
MQGKWINKPQGDTSVVFVHGILSGEECWKNDNGAWWPDLLKKQQGFEKTGIYVFTYSTGVSSGNYSIGDAVDSLRELSKLDNLFETAKRIVFVCHSMGGIAVRRFIVKHQKFLSEKQIPVGLFLVASPSLGSDYANWLSIITGAMGHTQAQALEFSQQNVWLNDLDRDFHNLISMENPAFPIRGKELIEDKAWFPQKTGFLRMFWKKQVVEPFSGAKYFGEPYKVPLSDHMSIAKPENADAVQHRLLCQFIAEMPEPGLKAVQSGNQGDSINIKADGDVVFAKDQGKAYNIKNSQIGVVGDNTVIKDGIHFNTK